MFRRVLKWGVAGGAVGLTLSSLHQNHWDVSTIGLLRFGRAAVTVGRIAVDYKLTLKGFDPSTQEYEKLKSEVHLRSAKKLLDLCCRNGGAFIKVGQHIGALNYLLPTEYVTTLRVLHQGAPRAPLRDVLAVVREDLGREASDIFETFDGEPVGAASLAQVHRATLPGGETVAVKVQHRNVRAHALVDMATMELLVSIVDRLFPEFTFMWLAEETKKNLPLELDFLHEGRNAERVRSMFCQSLPWLKVPRVHPELSTGRVLTMEFCEGGQVDDAAFLARHAVSPAQVSRRLGELYSQMIFVRGYVHCDPHPGNILVQPDGDIVLLDHGLYATLSDEFRWNYCHLWLSLLGADVAGVERWGKALGVGELFGLLACMITARSWTAVTKGIEATKPDAEESREIKNNAATYLPEITNVLSKVPREMLLVFKTNDLLRGIEGALGVKGAAGSFVAMSRCCINALYAEELRRSRSRLSSVRLMLLRSLAYARLFIYEWALWLSSSSRLFFHRIG